MAKMGKFSAAQMKKLQKNLNKVQKADVDAFVESCAKELAARLLGKVIKRTPVGVYPKSSGKKGGTLRRGWTGGSGSASSSGAAYADSLTIQKEGNMITIEIVNPVEYASYVEYGHRTVNGGWVNGRFMLTTSEQEVQQIAPNVLESKIKKYLGGIMS